MNNIDEKILVLYGNESEKIDFQFENQQDDRYIYAQSMLELTTPIDKIITIGSFWQKRNSSHIFQLALQNIKKNEL
jgi:hypothetical protein